METTTAHTSAEALNRLTQCKRKRLQDELHDICLAAQRNGADDMSGREIQAAYERLTGKRIDASSISSRINSLVAAGRLVRLDISRACKVTGNNILPVRVPATQARLVD